MGEDIRFRSVIWVELALAFNLTRSGLRAVVPNAGVVPETQADALKSLNRLSFGFGRRALPADIR